MKKKGQASIELILLLAVVLLLIQTIILPSFQIAETAAEETSSMAILKTQAQKLSTAIELVDSSPVGARQTIHVLMPSHSRLGYSSGSKLIYFQLADLYSNPIEACKYDVDTFSRENQEFDCTGGISTNAVLTESDFDPLNRRGSERNAFFTVIVSKTASGVVLNIEG